MGKALLVANPLQQLGPQRCARPRGRGPGTDVSEVELSHVEPIRRVSISEIGILSRGSHTVVAQTGPLRSVIVKIRKSEYLVVARLLKEARERSGLTQRDVAARLKVPQSFVSKYESAERRLDVLELRRLCRVLKISLPDLIRNIESSLGGSE